MALTPPPDKFFATINDIPDETTATINELLNDIDTRQFFNTVVTTLNKYSIGSNNHRIVPSVLATSYYALQNHGYIPPKSSLDIKIKFGGKMKKYKIIFDEKKKNEKVSREKVDDPIAKTIMYDIEGLPVLAELLANAVMLTDDTVKQRLTWLESNETTFKTHNRNEQQTTIESQIKCLIEDLTDYWKNDQTIGWQKLIRSFLLGFEMHSFYENILSKKSNKKNKRKNASDTNESNSNKSKEWDFVKKNVEIYSKCINTIMKSNQIIDVINKSAKDLNPETDDYNFQNAVKELTSKMKDSMKFSYLLYYFVLMFGYIALISPPTTDQAKLLKYLKLKDFNEIIEKFNHLRSKPLGKDIIQANNVHGKTILTAVLNCAKRLNINNEKLKHGLSMINNNYLFRAHSDPAKNSNDKSSKKARLAFSALGTDTESAASSSTNNSRNKQGWQRRDEFESYKSNIEALQSELHNLKNTNRARSPVKRINNKRINNGRIAKPAKNAKNKNLNRVKSEEDELSQISRDEYDSGDDRRKMISRHGGQHAVPNTYGVHLEDYSFGGEVNPAQKSDMHNKIVTIMNGLNQETITEINNTANHMIQNEMGHLNFSQEDKSIISNYQVLVKFVNDNNFEIVSERDKENYNSAINIFNEGLTDQQKTVYDDTVTFLKQKSEENPYLRFRSESDIDLILANNAIEECTNGFMADEFYKESKSDDMVEST
jgi:hypothetical protein